MSIMVEYDLPKWCEGCNALSTEKRYVGDIDFPYYLTCKHLNLCDALRTQWKLDDKQWISVKDKLPDNNEQIVVMEKHRAICRAKFEGGYWRELYTGFDIHNVECWVPEPELPKEGEEND